MYVVLGASGNTGKVVAETLLRQKKKVRVVLHDAAKGRAWGEAGADVAIANVDEGATLERAFSGAEGVYVLLPPNFSSSHVRVDNNRRTHTIAAAVEAAGVPHAVLLSSIGAQQSDGTGPRDVGIAVARLLAEGGSGKRVIELAGPREYTPRDVAAVVGRIVGKPIAVQQAPEEAMAPALMGAGMNAEWARLFQELTHGLNANIVVWEGGHPFWRGETEIERVLSTLLGKVTAPAARGGSSS